MKGMLNLLCVAAAFCSIYAVPCRAGETVILTSRRDGSIEIANATNLEAISRFEIGPNANGIEASPDGATLFVTKGLRSDPNGCCGLYAIDLKKGGISFLLEPALTSAISPADGTVFAQQGSNGVFVFDAKTFAQKPKLQGPGVYGLRASPDGRWLFGITSWPDPSLDEFDLERSKLVRSIKVPSQNLSGVWLGQVFYLYALDGEGARLWKLTPDKIGLDAGAAIQIPAFAGAGSSYVPLALDGANGHLFLHEVFGMKLDRRSESSPDIPGGVYEINSDTGAVGNALAPGMHFARLIVAPDAGALYGIDVESLSTWGHVRLIKLDAKSGQTLATRELEPDVWNIALADIPAALIASLKSLKLEVLSAR